MWCIPPQQDAAFVCAMEQVLGVYTRPYDAARPVICMDETTKQCVREVRTPLAAVPGHPARFDAEYERNGVGHLLLGSSSRRCDPTCRTARPSSSTCVTTCPRRTTSARHRALDRSVPVPEDQEGASLKTNWRPPRFSSVLSAGSQTY